MSWVDRTMTWVRANSDLWYLSVQLDWEGVSELFGDAPPSSYCEDWHGRMWEKVPGTETWRLM